MPAKRKRPDFLPAILPVGLILLWEIMAHTGILPARILPAPEAAAQAAWRLILNGDLAKHLWVSTGRALTGLAIGGSIGFILGLLTGASNFAERFLDSTVQMFRAIPNLALVPLVILWFGIGEEAKVTLIAVGVFFPIYLNTYHGVHSVEAGLREMGRVYGLSSLTMFTHILLPGALPSILVGLRFALGSMWLTLIAAEALAAESGIGFMTTTAREFMQTDVVLVGTLLYALLGKGADSLARLLERKLMPCRSSYQGI